MKYRSILTSLLTLTLAFAAHADVKSDIGYTELKAEFGDTLPDGSNLTVLMVEAPASGAWVPSSGGGLSYLKITPVIDTTKSAGTSAHATIVANHIANSSTSLLPKLAELKTASGNKYQTLSLRTGQFAPPSPTGWDLENHSYVATGTYDENALQMIDYRINRDGITVLGALNNSTGSIPPLWGNAYHTITVGTATGKHSRSGTNLEGSGRLKPDLVGSVPYTSYSTPVVSSAAGLLIAETKRTTSLAIAKDPRTIKALLMAGASKERFPSWANTSAQPLDAIYGAGQVNINNSYRMLIAGQQAAGATLRSLKGWDLSKSGTDAVYHFEVPAGQTLKLSTVMTWHRELPENGYFFNLTSTLANLNLRLRNSNSSFALGTIAAESTSALDNVEHIYRTALPPGRYALEVSGPAGTTYGIAWNGVLSGDSTTPSVPTIAAPTISAQPVALAVTEGQAARFSVTATGSSLSYQWTKNGVTIPAATASSYTIAATTLGNAGSYSVKVSNAAGAVVSRTASLTVAAQPVTEPPAGPTGSLTPNTFSARGQNGTTEGVANLFDGKTTTKWLDFRGATWVEVSFATAKALTNYSLTSANDFPERDPASWTLSGSTDGITWTVLDTRSAEVFAARYLKRDFALFQPSAAYRHYRIALAAKSGSITQLAELAFSSAQPALTPPPAQPAVIQLVPASFSARGQNGTKEGVANLFDGKTSTKWLDFRGTTWVQVSFATPRALDAYSLTSANDFPERDPASWTLSGSNDGTTWTMIESRSVEDFATRYQERDFVLDQTTEAYLHYRIALVATSGTITQLAELEFWGQ